MHSLDKIKQLLSEIGPMMSNIDSIKAYDNNRWSILFEEGITLSLDYAQTFNKLTLAAKVNKPEAISQHVFNESLLVFNYYYEQTGGVRAALDSPAGKTVLLFDISVQDIDLQRLIALLERFVTVCLQWSPRILQATINESSDYRFMNNEQPTNALFIRA